MPALVPSEEAARAKADLLDFPSLDQLQAQGFPADILATVEAVRAVGGSVRLYSDESCAGDFKRDDLSRLIQFGLAAFRPAYSTMTGGLYVLEANPAFDFA